MEFFATGCLVMSVEVFEVVQRLSKMKSLYYQFSDIFLFYVKLGIPLRAVYSQHQARLLSCTAGTGNPPRISKYIQ